MRPKQTAMKLTVDDDIVMRRSWRLWLRI